VSVERSFGGDERDAIARFDAREGARAHHAARAAKRDLARRAPGLVRIEETARELACAHIVIDTARRAGAADIHDLARTHGVAVKALDAGADLREPVFTAA